MSDCQEEANRLLKQSQPVRYRFTDQNGEVEEATWKAPKEFDPFDL